MGVGQFRVRKGIYKDFTTGETYTAGQIVESEKDLTKLFANKFVRVGGVTSPGRDVVKNYDKTDVLDEPKMARKLKQQKGTRTADEADALSGDVVDTEVDNFEDEMPGDTHPAAVQRRKEKAAVKADKGTSKVKDEPPPEEEESEEEPLTGEIEDEEENADASGATATAGDDDENDGTVPVVGDEEEEDAEAETEEEQEDVGDSEKFGTNVTHEFGKAEENNLLVFKKGSKFTVAEKGEPGISLHGKETLTTKAAVNLFVKKHTKSSK